jgi:translation elongation factor EF-Ts
MDLAEYKGVYVIAEQFEGKLRNVSFELLGQGRKLADGIGDEVGAVLIGYNVKPLAQELIAHGAHKVYVYDDEKLANKPEKVLAGIIEGKISKNLKDLCLVEQEFFLDPNMKVAQYLKENGCDVVSFVRYAVGEGIEKRQDNFAEEVMSQAFGG